MPYRIQDPGLVGDAHDLDVFAATIAQDRESLAESGTARALEGLLADRRRELRHAARRLGERVFAEKPGASRKCVRRYGDAWSREGTGRRRAISRASVASRAAGGAWGA